MARKGNSKYRKSLTEQVHERLYKQVQDGIGRSRHQDKANDDTQGRIYSWNSYHSYKRHCKYFVAWVKEHHPEVTNLKKAEKYAKEWLKTREDQGLSVSTLKLEKASLGKLYGHEIDYKAPKYRKEDIKRSRKEVANDRNFNEDLHQDLVNFAKGTGLRRSEMQGLRGGEIKTREELDARLKKLRRYKTLSSAQKRELDVLEKTEGMDYKDFVYVRQGKGGRSRYAPIVGPHADEIGAKIRETPEGQFVFMKKINKAMDVHSYRADYAAIVYRENARPVEKIPKDRVHPGLGYKSEGAQMSSEIYYGRGEHAGVRFDRKSLAKVSRALGHNRVEVVVKHYAYKF